MREILSRFDGIVINVSNLPRLQEARCAGFLDGALRHKDSDFRAAQILHACFLALEPT